MSYRLNSHRVIRSTMKKCSIISKRIKYIWKSVDSVIRIWGNDKWSQKAWNRGEYGRNGINGFSAVGKCVGAQNSLSAQRIQKWRKRLIQSWIQKVHILRSKTLQNNNHNIHFGWSSSRNIKSISIYRAPDSI